MSGIERRNRMSFFQGSVKASLAVLAILCSHSFSTWAASKSGGKAGVDFNRDIRPIFSDNCYACHGPDQNKRKAGLRLDQQEGAMVELKSGNHAIIPARPEQSALISRITTKDEDDRMPPLKTGKTLTGAQIDL